MVTAHFGAAKHRMPMQRQSALMPILATMLGIGFLSLMDAFMKTASLAIGAYSAALLRAMVGFALIAPLWLLRQPKWPEKPVLRIHLTRGLVGSMMALSFFYALTKLPLAETIAISFIAPVVSLYLAALILGEKIRREAILGALLGLFGTLVIVGGKLGRGNFDDDALLGLTAIVISALLYAWNLVLQRQQALVAKPTEVATFYLGIAALVYLAAAPWLLQWPNAGALKDIGAAAVLTVGGALTMSWAYGRAEAQVLVPMEYTGFLWASLFGWIMLAEKPTWTTIGGAALIVVGCLIATRRRPELSSV